MQQTTKRLTSIAIVLPLVLSAASACQGTEQSTSNSSEQNAVSSAESESPPALDDGKIAAAIERELFYYPSLSTKDMKVDVTDGVALLKGKVSNLLDKSRAMRIASLVKGVRAVDNRLSVVVSPRDDADLKDAVESALKRDPSTERYDVSVQVSDQVVSLTGQVQSHSAKQWLERTVEQVIGVKQIKNLVTVKYPQKVPDTEIREAVERGLHWDDMVRNGLVRTSVSDGYVTLTGVVGSLAEKLRASAIAWVAGVKGVDDRQLQVHWWAQNEDLRRGKYLNESDGKVSSALREAILGDPRVNSFAVSSNVKAGVATLGGTVSTIAAKNAAQQIAENTVGVTRVENDIDVIPDTVLDPELALRVNFALDSHVLTASNDIHVEVHHGVAKLTGTVPTYAHRAQAEVVAESVRGVRDVDNQLFVETPRLFVSELSNLLGYPYVAPWADRLSSVPLKTDLEMQSDVERELEWSPYVSDDKIEVQVQNGVVTLEGKIHNSRERRAAVANAYQGGAVKVIDRLKMG